MTFLGTRPSVVITTVLVAVLTTIVCAVAPLIIIKAAEDVTSGDLLVMYEHKTAAIAQMCAPSTQRAKVWSDRRESLRQLLDVLEMLRTVKPTYHSLALPRSMQWFLPLPASFVQSRYHRTQWC